MAGVCTYIHTMLKTVQTLMHQSLLESINGNITSHWRTATARKKGGNIIRKFNPFCLHLSVLHEGIASVPTHTSCKT